MNLLTTSSVLCFFLLFSLTGNVLSQSFSSSILQGIDIKNPTSLQFGPDGRLYISELNGTIKVFKITKNGSDNYAIKSGEDEVINLVKRIPNHYDDGTDKPYNKDTNKRQVTGLFVSGTPTNPVIYVSSSDNDIGEDGEGDVNLCTNSGVISKLYKENGEWKKTDLVRGLPRSERDHSLNGLQLHKNKLYLSVGGMTNSGAPSNRISRYGNLWKLSNWVLST